MPTILDIGDDSRREAFLQGLTTEEVAACTGEAKETTHFTLPRGSAAILRLISGFE